jgi:hypothetical protein
MDQAAAIARGATAVAAAVVGAAHELGSELIRRTRDRLEAPPPRQSSARASTRKAVATAR